MLYIKIEAIMCYLCVIEVFVLFSEFDFWEQSI